MKTRIKWLICGLAVITVTVKATEQPVQQQLVSMQQQLDAVALLKQGIKFVLGDGVPKNPKEAARIFRLLANQGNEDAQKALKLMFEGGLDVPVTDQEAVMYFRESPNQSQADIFCLMGMNYSIGIIPDRKSEATKWLRKAADLGHKQAKEFLELLEQKAALKDFLF